jgi:hypothetical protein
MGTMTAVAQVPASPTAGRPRGHNDGAFTSAAVAQASFAVAAGVTRPIRIQLNGVGIRLLARYLRLKTTVSFTGVALPDMTLAFAYPFVVDAPDQRWVGWTWANQPCSFCWTTIYQRFRVPDVLGTATVRMTCTGSGCPGPQTFGPRRRPVDLVRFFGTRRFGPSVLIRLEITAPDTIGRVVTWRTQAGSPPSQTVRCMLPGARRATACPASG